MNIFWVVNVVFPFPANVVGIKSYPFGGWLLGLYNSIKSSSDINKLYIASIYDGNEIKKINEDNVIYFLIPRKNQNVCLEKVISSLDLDLIHLHGTEYAYGYYIQNKFPNIKTVVSIQGLVGEIANFYLANISFFDVLKNLTFKDILKGSIYREKYNFVKSGIIEKCVLNNSSAIIGRTNWDYASSYSVVGYDKYFKCNEILRDSFYYKRWDYSNIEKNSIFVSQANYPVKGFHILLKALYVLKYKYNFSNIKVYVAGKNILDVSNFFKKIKMSGYSRYIKKLIRKYNLDDSIIFTGLLSENEVLKYLCKTNVFVQASSIENSPNSLGEAMIIGMPCVASNVGGTSDMLVDKIEGYLYPFGDYNLLAYYIAKVFNNSDESIELGINARKHALITHDRKINSERMVEIYKEVTKNEKK